MMFYISFIQVNIVPVIAKADTLTQEECTKFKKQVALAGRLVLLRNFNLELIKVSATLKIAIFPYNFEVSTFSNRYA